MIADQIALWPGVAPGSEAWTHEVTWETDPLTGTMAYRNVVVPTITPFAPPEELRNGTSVVIAPGGAFVALAWQHEGIPTAEWFAARGVMAFLLKYRVAKTPDPTEIAQLMAGGATFQDLVADAVEVGVADGEQAVRLVRSRVDEWGIDPDRIGILGYSAGGTIALRTAATSDETARPAFVANIYGAFFERDVPAEAPPCFTLVAADDLASDWCLDAARRWRAAGRPIELHVYERGGHGFALRKQGLPIDDWTGRLADWLESQDVL